MASPFHSFRKNQKVWMVALTLLCMFSFVFFGQWSRLGQSSGAVQDPEVFTWKYGTVRKSDIDSLAIRRRFVRQFFFEALRGLGYDSNQLEKVLEQKFSTSPAAIVDLMLMDKKAEQMGLVISDSMVNQFITGMTQNKLTSDQLGQIFHNMSSRMASISQAELFDAIRAELGAMYVNETFSQLLVRSNGQMPRFEGDTPADRWEYFNRVNRKVTAELMPVAVQDYVSKIPDPTDKELTAFYDLYKNNEPIPGSPTPGFKHPFRAKFEYIKADNDKLMKDTLAQVTEEEIKEFYEKNKDSLYKKSKLPDLPSGLFDQPGDKPEGKGDAEKDAAKPAEKSDGKFGDSKEGDSKADAGKAGSKTGDAKSQGKATTTPDAKKSDTKSPAAKGTDSKSTGAKSGDAKKTDDTKKPDDAKKSTDGKQSSMNLPASLNGELLALADDATPPTAKAPAAATKADSKTAKSDSAKSDTKSSDAKTPDSKTSDAKKADTKSSDAKTPDAKAADSKTTDSQTPEYKPLSEVHDRVRDQVAQKKIDDKIKNDFSIIQSNMSMYRNRLETYRRKLVDGPNNAGPKPEPPSPDVLALFDSLLEPKTTDLISILEARDNTDIGKSQRIILEGDYSFPKFIDIAYAVDAHGQPTLKPYQLQQSYDNDNNQYLWWKVSDEPASVPPLDQIKPEVIQAWKLIEARKPAMAVAQADAARANKEHKTLKEVFSSAPGEISTVGPFAWYTRSMGMSAPQLSMTKVSGVDQAGPDFMKAVFALKPGESGVAPNQSQNVYYVAQVESEEPPLEELRTQFMEEMATPSALPIYAAVGYVENVSALRGWRKELENEFDFKLAPGQALSTTSESWE